MIPFWLTILAFCFVAYLTRSRTYSILAFSAICNLYIDNFTHADDQYLMVTYASIEFFTAFCVLVFGDIHKLYQSSVLALMLLLHFTMEAALVVDDVWFIESGIYTYGMSLLIIVQLMGAGRGTKELTTLHQPWYNRLSIRLPDLQNH
jgi:hypothetical protein